MRITDLRCDGQVQAESLNSDVPFFTWRIENAPGEEASFAQAGYRIETYTAADLLPESLMWDSGPVDSPFAYAPYGGPSLMSRTTITWRVSVWSERGDVLVGEPARFTVGLCEPGDWKARWLASPFSHTLEAADPHPAPCFRREFTVEFPPADARLYIAAGGFYELTLDGLSVSDALLGPTPSMYHKTLFYDVYDLTDRLAPGRHCLGVMLGNGWYNDFTSTTWQMHVAPWRGKPRFLLQIELRGAGGEAAAVCSGEGWRAQNGPIVSDALRSGEHYEAARALKGFDKPGYADDDWLPAPEADSPGGRLVHHGAPPVTPGGVLSPVHIAWDGKQALLDFGSNIAGRAKLRMKGKKGQTVRLRYGERLDASGKLDNSDLDIFNDLTPFQTDSYTFGGNGVEAWRPRFTYHGFQYIEVTGLSHPPDKLGITAEMVHSALERTGTFQCDSLLLNQIYEAAIHSTIHTFQHFPVDCPQREKLGWTGDAWVSSDQTLLGFDAATAYRSWLLQFMDAQRPSGQMPGIIPTGGWGYDWGNGPSFDLALFMLPWNLYLYTGDRQTMRRMLPYMEAYMGYLDHMSVDGVPAFGLGDWCPPNRKPDDYTVPLAVSCTAFAYLAAEKLSAMAGVLGLRDKQETYAARAARTKRLFNERFVDERDGIVQGDSQSSQSFAIALGLLSEDVEIKAGERLREALRRSGHHVDCGIFGTKFLLQALDKIGAWDDLFELVTQDTAPGWGYMIRQGASTLWEKWSGRDSRLHHMLSSVLDCFYGTFAGIRPDEQYPGFKRTHLAPRPCGLTEAEASLHTPYGFLKIAWRLQDDTLEATVQLPPNTDVVFHCPPGFSPARETLPPTDGSGLLLDGGKTYTLSMRRVGEDAAVRRTG